MTVRVERTFEVTASPEHVWAFIADPTRRAESISVVSDFDVDDPAGHRATWHVDLPIPFVRKTITVETEDVIRTPPEYVEFVGKSKVMRVVGEHRIVPTETGSKLENTFVVDGRVPGVETFFKRNLDGELENLRRGLERYLEAER
ncbi:SRPBCC family protein [Natronobiforma cellulositropha]|uniref:SRPBCC family protein n=1 Tax=Natronobiforma cellulositropha TaxID=1679076 RepID=UPI0021D5EEA2|nr:SRPBCC family protein [Natronobiforma cellulositropha]